tara:strand:- start:66989 stop:68290 length:1302 start_codon:yes stop_codon:yes gene_type:complete
MPEFTSPSWYKNSKSPPADQASTEWSVGFVNNDGSAASDLEDVLNQTTMKEVTLSESLLTPGVQTTINIESANDLVSLPMKNLDLFYNKTMLIYAKREILKNDPQGNKKFEFSTAQRVYRLSDRKPKNYQAEQFSLHGCDPSLLEDVKTWVNAGWRCRTPSDITKDVFLNCLDVGPDQYDIENSGPTRDFMSENLHPFQVIRKQAEAAIAGSKDPSYVHFMTYQNRGHDDIPTHNFRSLTRMAKQDPEWIFTYSAKASDSANYSRPGDIMKYNSPCDFDLISDLMNGYDENGNKDGNILQTSWDDAKALFFELVNGIPECGGVPNIIKDQQAMLSIYEGCPTIDPVAVIYRASRMALLDKDKVAMQITIPFNPQMNVGRTIDIMFYDKNNKENYGSGRYLITNMLHNLKAGGFGVTVLDCVSDTVAAGKAGDR